MQLSFETFLNKIHFPSFPISSFPFFYYFKMSVQMVWDYYNKKSFVRIKFNLLEFNLEYIIISILSKSDRIQWQKYLAHYKKKRYW